MNIVKLKDIILDESCGLSPEKIELFNTQFKGRYVHCINWTYLIPLEAMDNAAAIELSKELCIDLLEPTVAVGDLRAMPEGITTTIATEKVTSIAALNNFIANGYHFLFKSYRNGIEYWSAGKAETGKYLTAVTDFDSAIPYHFDIEQLPAQPDGIFAFRFGTEYMTVQNNGADLLFTTDSVEISKANWSVDFDTNGVLTVKMDDANKIGFNVSSPRFKTYKNSSFNTGSSSILPELWAYKEVPVRLKPDYKFAEETITIVQGGATVFAQVFGNVMPVDEEGNSLVRFAIEGAPDVISVDAITGEITILKSGQAYIRAYNDESEYYEAYGKTMTDKVMVLVNVEKVSPIYRFEKSEYNQICSTFPYDAPLPELLYVQDDLKEQIVFESNNENVQIIKGGILQMKNGSIIQNEWPNDTYHLKIMAPCEAIISAKNAESDNYKGHQANVRYIASEDPVKPKKDPDLTFDIDVIEVKQQKTVVVKAHSTDEQFDGHIKYSVDDPDIAFVNPETGVVFGFAPGVTVINAISEETDEYNAGETCIQVQVTKTTIIDKYPWFYLDELAEYVDENDTEKVNAIYKYVEYNSFTPDKELTLEEIKMFRTWLATVLFNLLSPEPDVEKNTIAMLNYYKNEMTDSVIDTLASFHVDMPQVGIYTAGVQGVTGINILSPVKTSSCSCSQSSTAALLAQASSVSMCDPIAIYRRALYSQMVAVFSDINFWMEREKDLLLEIKRYIDAIIKLNLPLTASQYVSELYDCNCLTSTDSAQDRLMSILKNLSTAFGYMANDELTGHKNFIGDTLNQWSAKLYEIMRW